MYKFEGGLFIGNCFRKVFPSVRHVVLHVGNVYNTVRLYIL